MTTTQTPTPPPPPSSPFAVLPAPTERRAPGFGATVRSEWIKLVTAKGPRRNLVLGTVLGIALSALLAAAAGATFSDWTTSDQAEFDPVLYSFAGAIVSGIFFIAVGVRVATSEYATGMIRITFAATPRRKSVLGAKATVVAGVTLLFGVIGTIGMVGVSQLVFAAYDLESTGMDQRDTWWAIARNAAFVPLFPLLGMLFGFVFRSTAAAITTTLALLFIPSMFGALFPDWLRENVISLLPSTAVEALTVDTVADASTHLSTVPALAMVGFWVVVPLVLTGLVLERRDA